jgi:hypothetical protein
MALCFALSDAAAGLLIKPESMASLSMRRWQTSPITSVVVTPARSSFRHRSMKCADCRDSPSKPYTKILASTKTTVLLGSAGSACAIYSYSRSGSSAIHFKVSASTFLKVDAIFIASSHDSLARAMRSERPRAGQCLRTNAASFGLFPGAAEAFCRRRGLLLAPEAESSTGDRLMTKTVSSEQNLLHTSLSEALPPLSWM